MGEGQSDLGVEQLSFTWSLCLEQVSAICTTTLAMMNAIISFNLPVSNKTIIWYILGEMKSF